MIIWRTIMNVGKYLEKLGEGVLRDRPAGVIVADLVEIAIKDVVDESATAADVVAKLGALGDDDKNQLLSKELPAGLVDLVNWKIDQPAPKGGFIANLLVGVLILADCFISGIIGWRYFGQDIVPSEDMVMIILGAPVVGICTYYGVGTDKLVQAVLDYGARRKTKE